MATLAAELDKALRTLAEAKRLDTDWQLCLEGLERLKLGLTVSKVRGLERDPF